MKKFLFLTMLFLFGFGYSHAEYFLTVWDSTTGANKQGCSGLVSAARAIGISVTGDNLQIPCSNKVSFVSPVTINQGDVFCIHDTSNGDIWVKTSTPIKSGATSFTNEGGNDMVFAETFTCYGVQITYTSGTYTITFFTEQTAGVSSYWLDVWDLSETDTWDSAGGLYEPLKESTTHKLDDKYYATYTDPHNNSTKDYIAFYGPLTEDEVTTNNLRDIEGSQVYVIDFTNGGEFPEGLFIKAPTADIMGTLTPEDNNSNYHKVDCTPLHMRSGVRFGLLNNRYSVDSEKIFLKLRYVKWGHCFRLNEHSRPLNAFVSKVNADGAKDGGAVGTPYLEFTDEYGPNLWNGNNNNEIYGVPDENWTMNNKKGDSRLLSEHDLYLQKIYLEVTFDEWGYEHFYLRFEGKYDLEGAAGSQAHNHFIPSELNNEFSTTPNIFIGSDIFLDDRAFERFYNLDTENTVKLSNLGFSSIEEYNTAMSEWYKNMNFTDKYKAISHHHILKEAFDAKSGETISKEIADGTIAPSASATIKYSGDNGKFHKLANPESVTAENIAEAEISGDEISTYAASTYTKGTKTLVQGLEKSLIFDPTHEDAPKSLLSEVTYYFDNARISPTYYTKGKVETVIDFDGGLIVSAKLEYTNETKDEYYSSVDWSGSNLPCHERRIMADGVASIEKENYPVTSWAVSHAAEASDCTKAELAAVEYKGYTLDASNQYDYEGLMNIGKDSDFATYRGKALAEGESMLLHYHVDALYTFGLVQGVYDASEFTISDAMYSQSYESNDKTYTTESNVSYKLYQEVLSGDAHTQLYDNTVLTGIEAVETNCTPEYYNLQGIKVENPENGAIYIVKRGSKVSKEILK